MESDTATYLARSRGTILGLLLGDAIGGTAGQVDGDGPLRATSAGQLACFTVDGVIRASVRFSHRGICHPPSVIWHAYTRWATAQSIPGIEARQEDRWPDGWLANVPIFRQRRGSAPATVTALQGGRMGTAAALATSSLGAHAVTRCLPIGAADPWVNKAPELAAEMAATTHAAEAIRAAATAVAIVAGTAPGTTLADAVEHAQRDETVASLGGPAPTLLQALDAAGATPAQPEVLARLAPDATAASALAGGVYAAVSLPDAQSVRDAIVFAAAASDGGHAATVTGALLGAVHGPDALPVDWLSRLELAWVGDTLARDLIREFTEGPSGGEYGEAAYPYWWRRYPGW